MINLCRAGAAGGQGEGRLLDIFRQGLKAEVSVATSLPSHTGGTEHNCFGKTVWNVQDNVTCLNRGDWEVPDRLGYLSGQTGQMQVSDGPSVEREEERDY